jgi:hypothetical protein
MPTAWQDLGYQVKLWFLSLPNEDIAVPTISCRLLFHQLNYFHTIIHP